MRPARLRNEREGGCWSLMVGYTQMRFLPQSVAMRPAIQARRGPTRPAVWATSGFGLRFDFAGELRAGSTMFKLEDEA